MRCTARRAGPSPRASTRVLGFDPGADREEGPGQRSATAGRTGRAGLTPHAWHGCGRFSRTVDVREVFVIDWNVVVTVRQDFSRALALLRKLGVVERTGLFNVLVMRVPRIRDLLEQILQRPAEERFFSTISHVVPVTHKLSFSTAEDLERGVQDIVLGWAPELAGKSLHVRMRRRGHKGELHGLEVEQRIGRALLDELARRGTPGRFALADPDAVIAIETLRDEAGLALWPRIDLERYPFLRASIERGAERKAARVAIPSAPLTGL